LENVAKVLRPRSIPRVRSGIGVGGTGCSPSRSMTTEMK